MTLIKKAFRAPVEVIDGCPLALKIIIEENQPLKVILKGQVSNIVLNVIQSLSNLVIFRFLWFQLPFIFLGARAFMQAAKKNIAFAIYATSLSTSIKDANKKNLNNTMNLRMYLRRKIHTCYQNINFTTMQLSFKMELNLFLAQFTIC